MRGLELSSSAADPADAAAFAELHVGRSSPVRAAGEAAAPGRLALVFDSRRKAYHLDVCGVVLPAFELARVPPAAGRNSYSASSRFTSCRSSRSSNTPATCRRTRPCLSIRNELGSAFTPPNERFADALAIPTG